MTVDEIIRALPTLTASDLARVSSAVKAAQSLGPELSEPAPVLIVTETTGIEDIVLDTICKVVAAAGGERVHASMLKRAMRYATFKKKLPGLIEWLEAAQLSRLEMRSILYTGLDLLFRHLLTFKAAPGATDLLVQINRVPNIINSSFPGYVRGGLLKMLARSEAKP